MRQNALGAVCIAQQHSAVPMRAAIVDVKLSLVYDMSACKSCVY
jgi:hypothetical protein